MSELFWNFIRITLRLGCSPVNLLHIFRISFPNNTSEGLLLSTPVIKDNFKQRHQRYIQANRVMRIIKKTQKMRIKNIVKALMLTWYRKNKNKKDKGRSSHPELFLGNGVQKIYSKFIGEHPCRSVISKQLYWNHTSAWVFSCQFAVNFKYNFS